MAFLGAVPITMCLHFLHFPVFPAWVSPPLQFTYILYIPCVGLIPCMGYLFALRQLFPAPWTYIPCIPYIGSIPCMRNLFVLTNGSQHQCISEHIETLCIQNKLFPSNTKCTKCPIHQPKKVPKIYTFFLCCQV